MSNLNSMYAASSLEDQTANLSSEEAIEVCNAVIAEAERIIEICEKEIEEREEESEGE